eukprot:TRINITY_DN2893_c0_g1_i2.p1 TRINITY_DN2893_c0_g1~~TRINITY_DN2893_c0_g1_i2.p1  ORF type:complete len:154 (-),score=44.95 TRINITY_DN2893_c0_g1_i2:33-494(-)
MESSLTEKDVVDQLKRKGKFDDLRKQIMVSILDSKEDEPIKSSIKSLLNSPKVPQPKEPTNNPNGQRKYFQILSEYLQKETSDYLQLENSIKSILNDNIMKNHIEFILDDSITQLIDKERLNEIKKKREFELNESNDIDLNKKIKKDDHDSIY